MVEKENAVVAIKQFNVVEKENAIKKAIKAIAKYITPTLLKIAKFFGGLFVCCRDFYNFLFKRNSAVAINTENTEHTEQTEQFRNILIVGRTGSGKSTLANVLLGEKKFSEVHGSTSGTRRTQSEVFEWNGNNYRVIDTIGTRDTAELSDEEIMSIDEEIANNLGDDEIKQVFFVFKDRFTKEQVEALKLIKDLNILTSYITIVCTNFPKFEDKKECEADVKRLLTENDSIVEVIKNCKIIHVDNPPPEYGNVSRKRREFSRKRLLNHLKFTCEFDLESIDVDKMVKEIAQTQYY